MNQLAEKHVPIPLDFSSPICLLMSSLKGFAILVAFILVPMVYKYEGRIDNELSSDFVCQGSDKKAVINRVYSECIICSDVLKQQKMSEKFLFYLFSRFCGIGWKNLNEWCASKQ